MSAAADCIAEALDVWREAGLYERSEMRPFVEQMEELRRKANLSEERKIAAARTIHRKSMKHQFQITIGKAKSAEVVESVTNRLLVLADTDPELALASLNDLIEFGIAKGKAVRADGQRSMVGLRKAIQMELDAKLFDIKNRYFRNVAYKSTDESKLLRLEMEGGNSGDPQIKADADFIKEVFLPYNQELRDLGVYVGYLDQWSFGRPSEGMVRAHLDEFKEFLRLNLDLKFHPDTEDSVEFITNSILDPTPPRDRVLSMSREVFLKTPEARVEYMTRFGQADFIEALNGHINQTASAIAQATVLGPDARMAMNSIAEAVTKRIAQKHPKMQVKPAQIMEDFDVANNAIQDVYNPKSASVTASARNYASASFLGAVTLAQVSQDAVLIPLQAARSQGWASAFTETTKAYAKTFSPQLKKYLQEQLGIMEHVSHLMTPDARIAIDSPITRHENFSRKVAIQAMRLSGTEFIEQKLRGIAALTSSRGMIKNLDMSWADLDPAYKTLLENNAIGKRSWDNLRSQKDSLLNRELKTIDLDNISSPDLRRAVRSFIVRETESMVLRPDTTTRRFLAGGTRGTVGGEVTRFASQFLSWPTDFQRKVTMRQISLGVPGAIATAVGIFGASIVTEQLYAVLRGQPSYAMDNPNVYWRALVRSGLLTPPGELIVGSTLGDWRASPSLGPVLDTTAQSFGRIGAIGQAAFEQDSYEAMSQAVRLTRTLLPNTWYIEGAIIEPAYQAIMWELDPDHMRQRERNWEQERK